MKGFRYQLLITSSFHELLDALELSKIVARDSCRASRMDRALTVNVSIYIFTKKSIVEMATWARNLAGGGATMWACDGVGAGC